MSTNYTICNVNDSLYNRFTMLLAFAYNRKTQVAASLAKRSKLNIKNKIKYVMLFMRIEREKRCVCTLKQKYNFSFFTTKQLVQVRWIKLHTTFGMEFDLVSFVWPMNVFFFIVTFDVFYTMNRAHKNECMRINYWFQWTMSLEFAQLYKFYVIVIGKLGKSTYFWSENLLETPET